MFVHELISLFIFYILIEIALCVSIIMMLVGFYSKEPILLVIGIVITILILILLPFLMDEICGLGILETIRNWWKRK